MTLYFVQVVTRHSSSAVCRLYCKDTDQLLSPETKESDTECARTRGRSSSVRKDKEETLDLSGPRARLHMSADVVVAGRGERRRGENTNKNGLVTTNLLIPRTKSHNSSSTQFCPPQVRAKLMDRNKPGSSCKVNKVKSTLNCTSLPTDYNANVPPPSLLVTDSTPVDCDVADDCVDILHELKQSVLDTLGSDNEVIAENVADSWKSQVEALEKIHKDVLSSEEDESSDATMVRRNLAAVYKWKGSKFVTRDKALVLTGLWVVNNKKKKDLRLRKEFKHFLELNPRFKLSLDEVVYILGRNGMNLVDLGQDFESSTTASTFKSFIQELIFLQGQLLAQFTDVLYGFFKSRAVKISSETKNVKKAQDSTHDLEEMFIKADEAYNIERKKKETNSLKKCDVKISKESEHLEAEIKLEIEKNKMLHENMKKVENESRLKLAKMEEDNAFLRSSNRLLEEEVIAMKEKEEITIFETVKLVEAVDLILEGGEYEESNFLNPEYTRVMEKLKSSLRNISEENKDSGVCSEKCSLSIQSSDQSREDVTLPVSNKAVSDSVLHVKVRLHKPGVLSSNLSFHTVTAEAGTQLLSLASLQELCPGETITAVKYRQGGRSKGWRTARIEGDIVHPPVGGWRDKYAVIFTAGAGKFVVSFVCLDFLYFEIELVFKLN